MTGTDTEEKETLMRRLTLPLLGVSVLALAGCSHPTYYVAQPPPPPPPGYRQAPPLVQVAEQNGFRAGQANGSSDAYTGRGYRPQRDHAFHATPGYDANLGPFPPYRQAFRDAYLRGYDQGFHHPQSGVL
jgi:hypothetical protein